MCNILFSMLQVLYISSSSMFSSLYKVIFYLPERGKKLGEDSFHCFA
jgi:hypothetical protein